MQKNIVYLYLKSLLQFYIEVIIFLKEFLINNKYTDETIHSIWKSGKKFES